MDYNKGDVVKGTTPFSSSQPQEILDSIPILPDGGCRFNVLESMVADKGGIQVCDMIQTWIEIESYRKDARKRKNVDNDLVGSFIQRKFKCTGHSISGEKCIAEKVVGFAKGKNKKFRSIKYINKHTCEQFIRKRNELENQPQSVTLPSGESSTTPRVAPKKTQMVYDLRLDFVCQICGKKFRFDKGLRRHNLNKHSSNDDQETVCNVTQQIQKTTVSSKMFCCTFCTKMYSQQNTLNRHLRSKHNAQEETEAENDFLDSSSSIDDLPSSPLPSLSTLELDSQTDQEAENRDRQSGYDDHFIGVSDRDLEDQTRVMKEKNDRDIVMEIRDDENRIIETHSNSYLHGAAKAIVRNIVTHQEFQEEVKCKDKSKEEKLNIKKKSKLFEKVTVAKDQNNAIHKHLDSASECEQTCVFLQRRIRLHKQQILLGLEAISTNTLSRKQFLSFVISHLKLLKLNDKSYRNFIAFVKRSFYGEMLAVIAKIESEISDKSSYEEELKRKEKTRELRDTIQQLQVSTDRLEKAQQKMTRREQRKKQRNQEIKADRKRGVKTHRM